MLLHIFALRWKPGTGERKKDEALAAIRAFPSQIPGILALQAGVNVSERSQGFETIGVLHFADREGLAAYLAHPAHDAFVAFVADSIEAVDLDLELSASPIDSPAFAP